MTEERKQRSTKIYRLAIDRLFPVIDKNLPLFFSSKELAEEQMTIEKQRMYKAFKFLNKTAEIWLKDAKPLLRSLGDKEIAIVPKDGLYKYRRASELLMSERHFKLQFAIEDVLAHQQDNDDLEMRVGGSKMCLLDLQAIVSGTASLETWWKWYSRGNCQFVIYEIEVLHYCRI